MKRTKPKRRYEEHEIQVNFVEYLRIRDYELYLDSFAIANGGKRHISEAKRLKAEGVKAGIPDIFIPLGRKGYLGLFMEIKKPDGVLSPAQKIMIPRLRARGYKVEVPKSLEQSIAMFEAYYC